MRTHTTPIEIIRKDLRLDFEIWVTLIRKPSQIYPSAYFQDIDTPEYDYFAGTREEVLAKPDAELLSHFLSFDWTQFPQTSYQFNFNQIKKLTGIDLMRERFDASAGYSIYQSSKMNMRVVALRTDKLSEPDVIEKIFTDMEWADKSDFTEEVKSGIKYLRANTGQDKWYGQLYRQLHASLPDTYYEKYRQSDREIQEKFFL